VCPQTAEVGFKDVAVPFDESWREWQPLARLTESMPRIRAHLEAAMAVAPADRQVEGLYQAALAKPTDAEFTLVDREVMLAFGSRTEKLEWKDELRRPLVQAQLRLAAIHPWAGQTSPPGDKLDALAIDGDGRLLAIEVKPGAETKGLTWTPIQVAMYVRLLRAWIEADEDSARKVLEGMVRQRAALALGSTEAPELCEPIEIVPVIAVGKPMTRRRETLERLAIVRAALREAGEPLTGLRFWAIEQTGDVSITDATELDERFR
jgi:hypothetical protein